MCNPDAIQALVNATAQRLLNENKVNATNIYVTHNTIRSGDQVVIIGFIQADTQFKVFRGYQHGNIIRVDAQSGMVGRNDAWTYWGQLSYEVLDHEKLETIAS